MGERSRAFSLERGAPKTLATLAPVFDATAEELAPFRGGETRRARTAPREDGAGRAGPAAEEEKEKEVVAEACGGGG